MQLSKGKKLTAFIGCFLMAMVIQVSSQALNNLGYQLLAGMGGESMFVLAATLSGLGTAVMCPIGAKLGDLYGRSRICLIGGIACFVLHLILAFTTVPILWVIIRTIIPFSLGLFLSIPFALPAELYPESYSQKAGIVSAALAAGIVVGSYGGGLLFGAGLAKLAVIVPGLIAVVGAILIAVSVPNRRSENVKLDVMGVVSLFVFLTALCLVLTFAGQWGYGSIYSIIGYVVIIASAILLFKTEQKVENPCLPFELFKNKTFLFLVLFAFFLSMHQYVMQVYTPMFGQNVLGLTTAATGSFQIPRTIICIVAPIFLAAILKKTPGTFKIYMALAAVLVIAAFALMVLPGMNYNVTIIYIAIAITGIGESLNSISANPLAVTTLEPQNIGIGIGLVSAMGSIGAQVSAAIVGLIFNANVAKGLDTAVFSTYYTIIALTVFALIFILCVKIPKAEKAAEN